MPNVGDIIRLSDLLPLFDLLDNNNTTKGYIGQIVAFPSSITPIGAFSCDGSELSREAYPELFEVIGTIYGEGDGSTTFNIPDYRGAFLRCIGGNADSIGVLQGDAIRNIRGSLSAIYNATTAGGSGGVTYYTTTSASHAALSSGSGYVGIEFDASRVVPTAEENRPINYSVNICIIYE